LSATRTTETYDLTTAAERLGIHRRSVRRLVDAGKLFATRSGVATGSRYSIPEEEIERIERERASS
jgi:excisionase family DNA binding protein